MIGFCALFFAGRLLPQSRANLPVARISFGTVFAILRLHQPPKLIFRIPMIVRQFFPCMDSAILSVSLRVDGSAPVCINLIIAITGFVGI
jgi:hypothetical protein